MYSIRSRVPGSTNPIARELAQLRDRGVALVDLTESNPTRAGLPYPTGLLATLARPAGLTYHPDPRGLPAARAAIAAHHGRTASVLDPDALWLTSCTSEAYGMLFKLLCDPGDELLVPRPGYPLFDHLARLENVTLRSYPLHYDGRWHIDLPALRAAVGERTRAVLCVNPNNPTGSFLKRTELQALEELGLPIISDEVFAEYPLGDDPDRVVTALSATRVPVFGLYGLSKTAGLPQLKLAWIAANTLAAADPELARRLDLISDCYLSVGTPVQQAAGDLLAMTAPIREAVQARVASNLCALRAGIPADSPLGALHVEGGWYALLRLPAVLDEEAWVLRLLRETHLCVQPGYFYDLAHGVHVVVSLLTPPEAFAKGIALLVAFVTNRAAG